MANVLSAPPIRSAVTLQTGNIAPVWNQWFQIVYNILAGNNGGSTFDSVSITGNQIIVQNSQTPPTSSSPGEAGAICWDSNFLYVCIATNTWKRVGIATW